MENFGEEGVDSTRIIDEREGRAKRTKIFCGARSNFPQIVLETKAINTNK